MTPNLLIQDRLRERLDHALETGALTGGWLISGPPMIGKASLARALAIAMLSHAPRLGMGDEKTVAQVENEGHPDLFILRRTPDEKTGRLPANIKVDDVREVISRFHQTSMTGRRVVIVDTADDLNVQAANALLKTLEEPPEGAALLLLSVAPGRLLPTVRSRCRQMIMPPLPSEILVPWLQKEEGIGETEAQTIAQDARGRPGRALQLSRGEGQLARQLAQNLLSAAAGRGDLIKAAKAFGEKDSEDARRDAQELFLSKLSDAARLMAAGAGEMRDFPGAKSPHHLITLHDEISSLVGRAEALNADKVQTAIMMAMTLKDGLQGSHAGR